MSKFRVASDGYVVFHCPGCECGHRFTVNGTKQGNGCSWQWNGSLDKPTVNPSLLIDAGGQHCCHSFIRDGQIMFLIDSKHKLAGQTVEIPEWDDV